MALSVYLVYRRPLLCNFLGDWLWFDEFCQRYQVQVTDEQALRSLLRDLREKELILEDPDFDEPWDVRKLERSEFSWLRLILKL